MDNSTDTGALVSAARQGLANLLLAIEHDRADVDEVTAQVRKLGCIKQAELSARERLDAIRQRDVRELSAQLVNPTGPRVVVDHDELAEAERELARATREADVARACEPEVMERLAQTNGGLAEMSARVPERAADVMLEQAAQIAAEIEADAVKLRTKYARLWSLKAFLGDAKLYRHAERAPSVSYPDNICPDVAEVHRAAPMWQGLAGRLASDPAACLNDQE